MLSRRIVLTSALGTAAAATLAACATNTENAGPSPSETAEDQPMEQPTAVIIGLATDIPVGGGNKFKAGDIEVFVTQPNPGEFRAFDARCTHAGCAVTDVVSGEILCPCHGARYNSDTGAVVAGPAPRALGKISITQVGDELEVSF
ncbi:MAG TPA: Rieske (2Fe-2S) protein [Microbacteriaceae bacterium]